MKKFLFMLAVLPALAACDPVPEPTLNTVQNETVTDSCETTNSCYYDDGTPK